MVTRFKAYAISHGYHESVKEIKDMLSVDIDCLEIMEFNKYSSVRFRLVTKLYSRMPQLYSQLLESMRGDDLKMKQLSIIVYLAMAFNLRVGLSTGNSTVRSQRTSEENYNLLLLQKAHATLLNDGNVKFFYQNKNVQIDRTVKVHHEVYQIFSIFLAQTDKNEVFNIITSYDITAYLKIVVDDNLISPKYLKKLRTKIEYQKEINSLKEKSKKTYFYHFFYIQNFFKIKIFLELTNKLEIIDELLNIRSRIREFCYHTTVKDSYIYYADMRIIFQLCKDLDISILTFISYKSACDCMWAIDYLEKKIILNIFRLAYSFFK